MFPNLIKHNQKAAQETQQKSRHRTSNWALETRPVMPKLSQRHQWRQYECDFSRRRYEL
jgi:hypothetical protein